MILSSLLIGVMPTGLASRTCGPRPDPGDPFPECLLGVRPLRTRVLGDVRAAEHAFHLCGSVLVRVELQRALDVNVTVLVLELNHPLALDNHPVLVGMV